MHVSLELQSCCGNMTGIGVYTYELVKRLRQSEELALQGNVFNFRGRNDLSGWTRTLPFPIVENRQFPYGVYRRIWKVFPMEYGRLFGRPADLTHFFNYIVPPHITGEVITTIHDLTYIRYPETVAHSNLRHIREGLPRSVERSSLIMTSSQFSKGEIVTLCGVPEEKVQVVYPAVDQTEHTCATGPLLERLHIRQPYLLYVGSIEPRKNLGRLLQAFDRLRSEEAPPFQLVICGGNGWNNQEFYDILSRMHFRESVCLTGYLPGEEKNALYKSAAAFVFPSIYEGFGIPLLEAMHWQTPVICSNVASLPEVAGDAACYVDPFSLDSIREGLCRVLFDPAYGQELVRKGTLRAREFNWQQSALAMQQMYQSLRP